MRPILRDYENIQLTEVQTSFDTRIATEVMGWTKLDDSFKDEFERHVLPENVYPFFETFGKKGILVYHPTPYHAQMFSPSINAEDDIASLITLLGKQPNAQSSMLSMLHFIHHQRAMQDAAFVPSDEFYRIARYYNPGDFATTALHLIETASRIENKDASKVTIELGRKYLGKNGIREISFSGGILKVKCRELSLITQDVQDDFASYEYRVEFQDGSI